MKKVENNIEHMFQMRIDKKVLMFSVVALAIWFGFFDIKLVDHCIVSETGYFSFSEDGRL